ncbi:hypothetical protein [Tropicibacter sp. R16_0]|uniref:hypothetical protein n=1 Tax=Tropicibacter sp. R16_0 TaxID=2821102 RepID=UPI00257062A1|nr:hypothetical protein [Tropicibacter sp. R16_0]
MARVDSGSFEERTPNHSFLGGENPGVKTRIDDGQQFDRRRQARTFERCQPLFVMLLGQILKRFFQQVLRGLEVTIDDPNR